MEDLGAKVFQHNVVYTAVYLPSADLQFELLFDENMRSMFFRNCEFITILLTVLS